jgi:transcription initiation factor TFIIE subunit alpha
MHGTVNKIKEDMVSDSHPQGYVCPMCGRRYTTLEVISTQSPDGMSFICDDCHNPLIEDDTSEESKANQERLRRLMDQLNPIISSLRRIDDTFIAENSFEEALAIAIPPAKSAPTNYNQHFNTHSRIPTGRSTLQSQQVGGVSLQVNITSGAETAKLERKQEEEKARLAEENALPAWHLESTVGKSMYAGDGDREPGSNAGDAGATTTTAAGGFDVKPGLDFDDDKKSGVAGGFGDLDTAGANATDNAVDEFFAKLNAKQQEEEEEDDDDDDDDDEFEDVPVAVTSTVVGDLDDDDSDSD